MLHLQAMMICRSLRSTHFHALRNYYEAVRLLLAHRLSLGFMGLVEPYLSEAADLPDTLLLPFLCSLRSRTPVGLPLSRFIDRALLPAAGGTASAPTYS